MSEHRILANGSTITAPGGATLTDVRSITLPEQTIEKVECTGLSNTTCRSYLAGKLSTPGTFKVTVPEAHAAGVTLGTNGAITVSLPNGHTYSCYGFLAGYAPSELSTETEALVDLTFEVTNLNNGTISAPVLPGDNSSSN